MDGLAARPAHAEESALAPITAPEQVEAFLDRWHDTGGSERANYQLFLTELCALLDLPQPTAVPLNSTR